MDQRHSITPFWNRLPRFFLYPLLPPALFVCVGYAILHTWLSQGNMMGWMFSVVVTLVLLNRHSAPSWLSSRYFHRT